MPKRHCYPLSHPEMETTSLCALYLSHYFLLPTDNAVHRLCQATVERECVRVCGVDPHKAHSYTDPSSHWFLIQQISIKVTDTSFKKCCRAFFFFKLLAQPHFSNHTHKHTHTQEATDFLCGYLFHSVQVPVIKTEISRHANRFHTKGKTKKEKKKKSD